MITGIELIAKERQEQIDKHRRSTDLDVRFNANFELLEVAELLISWKTSDISNIAMNATMPSGWDWTIYQKMCSKPLKERLIIAGALIAAEIDRLQSI